MIELQYWVIVILSILSFVGAISLLIIFFVYVLVPLKDFIENHKEYKEFFWNYYIKIKYIEAKKGIDKIMEELHQEQQEDKSEENE